jgi:hypothetical protein
MGHRENWLDPLVLARLLAELDTPMELHEAMIDAVDWLAEENFMREVANDPRVRAEWEEFLMTGSDDGDESF